MSEPDLELRVWILVNADKSLVSWKCKTDDEEGLEIHRTRKLAQGAKMAGEKIRKATLIWAG